jgi:HK97 family phage prohead protease
MNDCAVTRWELKAVDEEARTFSGLASTWDQDLGGDVIEAGAFKRTLSHWRKGKRILPLLDSHDRSSVRAVVGKLTEAEEATAGLEATFEVIPGPDGDEVFRRVKGGYVDGLSIGYQAVKVRYPETDEERASGVYRYLQEVKLHEVSVVLFPMNPGARIDTASVKALLAAARDHDLSDEERAELDRLGSQIRALSAPPGLAPDALAALEAKIRRVTLHRLATRLEAARHAGSITLARTIPD